MGKTLNLEAPNGHAKLIMPKAKLLLFLSLKACSTFSLSRFMVTLSFRLLKPNCLELSLNVSSVSVLYPPHPMHQYPLPVLPSEYIQNLNLFLSSPLSSPWSKTSLSLALDYCLIASVCHLLQRWSCQTAPKCQLLTTFILLAHGSMWRLKWLCLRLRIKFISSSWIFSFRDQQPAGACSFHGRWQVHKRPSEIRQAHLKSLLASSPLTFWWTW